MNKYKKEKILDFGCGEGTLSLYFASKGYLVRGVDVSDKAINTAKRSAMKLRLEDKVKFSTTSDERLKHPKEKIDLIICTEVLEHLQDDYLILTDFFVSLKKNGMLFISVPSKNAPLSRLGIADNFDYRVGHVRRYSEVMILNLVSRAGFIVEKIERKEGIFRNSLFVIPYLGFLVRFIKGPISDIVTFLDDISVKLFGESDLIIVARKT